MTEKLNKGRGSFEVGIKVSEDIARVEQQAVTA
jgi:hypothetical protein